MLSLFYNKFTDLPVHFGITLLYIICLLAGLGTVFFKLDVLYNLLSGAGSFSSSFVGKTVLTDTVLSVRDDCTQFRRVKGECRVYRDVRSIDGKIEISIFDFEELEEPTHTKNTHNHNGTTGQTWIWRLEQSRRMPRMLGEAGRICDMAPCVII